MTQHPLFRRCTRAVACASGALLVLTACGGGDGENTATAGELRTFTYEDTIDPGIIGPFTSENPDLELKTATFDSVDEGAAKLNAGFSTDVVEVCLDEAKPLHQDQLLAPIDTSRLTNWESLDPTFREANGVVIDGDVTMVIASAGPHGMLYDNNAIPGGIDSYTALFDPAYRGKVALDNGWLTALADAALASGITDPLEMTDDQIEQMKDKIRAAMADGQFRTLAEGDSDMSNLFKSGEVILADGGRGTAEMINANGGNVTWVAPKEGTLSWMCGLGISADAANVDAAYAFLDYYISPRAQGAIGDLGYVITNPKGLPEVSAEFQKTANPSDLEGTIPQFEPDNADVWRSAWQEIEAGA
ncbi:Spermidine-binding periplasmic protein SpuE [Mycolicibacterium vanbaalenii]|uniref:Spermidine-binding periplasmic protein SpuE n=1 Tax=Mycolicibacterium vanbaalenii TaxID=110539 RepID=A0A5S9QXY6_MYCVN|nr:extracellular solute-binding protein [Mycolicibacterium vanbaalenii]CAA0124798.1 Spermidine-binding periplasmic protein SpuE [Mycolicibacterium vanbaalenii]